LSTWSTIGWPDLALAIIRASFLAGVLSLAGTLAFQLLVAPFAFRRVAWPSLALALIGGGAWLVLQSGALAGVSAVSDMLAAVPTVLGQTWFGATMLARFAALLLAALLIGVTASRWWLAAALLCASGALAAQVAIGHAYASGDQLLMASLALHLLAVSAWLGGLLPLWLAIRYALIAVAVIVASGVLQARALIGSWSGLFDTLYGQIALIKIGLLIGLLALAVINRLVFTPALDRAPRDQRQLRVSLSVELALGVCVIAVAGLLASQAPPMDAQMAAPPTSDGG
jgi:putative copper export protein